jgi:hypothetical protein
MKLIELSQGRIAIVDDEDFEWLSKWKWHFHCGRYAKTGYARRTSRAYNQQQTILMHNEIYKHHHHQKPPRELDHINTCGSDNRKQNLRLATRARQKANQRLRLDNASGVTGVYWNKRSGKWQSQIRINRKLQHLGYFINKKDAIAARRQAEIQYFGEYRHNPKDLCLLWKTGQCPDCAKRAKELGLR